MTLPDATTLLTGLFLLSMPSALISYVLLRFLMTKTGRRLLRSKKVRQELEETLYELHSTVSSLRDELRNKVEALRARMPERTTSIAVWIAGARRNKGTEWRAHLVGTPERGEAPSALERRKLAFGFLRAAIRLRLRDWFGWAWIPIDWALRTKLRREWVTGIAVGSHAIYIIANDGVHALLTVALPWLGASAAITWGLLVWLAKKRGIELASDDEPPQG
ncbi:hypothetical protein [Streptomyces olivochromogenes]|uniref:hypothetical protein n=1 Tax=Streptomyces olivochromogenes TaxID=1963 RepID=UPI001F1AE30A|nr:hypothetical protein [Streptomyces olivochromogenes]MCF3130725.1 hypothetical protein [Streptomyces olivochromogenes]